MIDVVCAVMMRQDKVLCLRRKQRGSLSTAGRYEFPGGKIEPDETPFEAIRREIKEELEWNVTPRATLGTTVHEYPDFTIRLTAILCDAPPEGEPAMNDHDDCRWLTTAELSALDWAPADRRLLTEHILPA